MPSIRISCEYCWPAVDRTLEGVAGGARKAVEDELLDLALAVADDQRPALVLFRGDVAADLGGAGFEQLRCVAYRHLLGDRADLELYVNAECLGDAQNDILCRGRAEARGRHSDVIGAGRQVRQSVGARTGGGGGYFYAGGVIRGNHGCPGDDCSGLVLNRAVERADRTLRHRDPGADQEQHNRNDMCETQHLSPFASKRTTP